MSLKSFDIKKIILKELDISMVSSKYLQWMNSKNLMRHTEQRFSKHSIPKIMNFVKATKKSKNNYAYGIFIINDKKKIHVGNIKISQINFKHKYADISYFIGDIKFQNMETIRYQLNYEQGNLFNSIEYEIKPTNGMFIIFPSEVWHKITQNNSDITRYSLAMNFLPTGFMGYLDSQAKIKVEKFND